jgi:hypothetical protein
MGECTYPLVVALLLISQLAMIVIAMATVAIVFTGITMRTARVAMRITWVAWLIVEMWKFRVMVQRSKTPHLRAEARAGHTNGKSTPLLAAIDHRCVHGTGAGNRRRRVWKLQGWCARRHVVAVATRRVLFGACLETLHPQIPCMRVVDDVQAVFLLLAMVFHFVLATVDV